MVYFGNLLGRKLHLARGQKLTAIHHFCSFLQELKLVRTLHNVAAILSRALRHYFLKVASHLSLLKIASFAAKHHLKFALQLSVTRESQLSHHWRLPVFQLRVIVTRGTLCLRCVSSVLTTMNGRKLP